MCKHKYQIKSFQSPETCYLQAIFVRQKEHFSLKSFPLDDEGYCIFHSHHREWKIENHIEDYFYQFFDVMSKDKEQKEIDFRGALLYHNEGIVISESTTYKTLNLCSTHFETNLSFENSHFGGDVYLDAAKVEGIFTIEQCNFSDNFTAIQDVEFHSTVYLKGVTFSDLFDVQQAQFKGQVNITDVSFNGYTVFDRAIFKSEQTGFSYFKCFFNDYTSFKGTEFHGPVQFENCIFNGETQFVKTLFKSEFYFALPEIKTNVFFKGASEDQPIFENEIEMQLSLDSFEGAAQLVFEHANLVFLDRVTKNKLAELKANRKIVLGKGTMVFRFSFQETFLYGELDEILILDLLTTIKHYFTKKLARHFEFVLSQKGEDLVVTFFSDDYMRADDFKRDNMLIIRELSSGLDVKDSTDKYLQDKFNFLIESLFQQIETGGVDASVIKVLADAKNLTLVMNNPVFKNVNFGKILAGGNLWLGDGEKGR